MVAVINNFGGFYSTELYFSELRKTGAEIHLPDVNESEYLTTIKGNDVYTGFVHIKSLQQEMAEKIITERKRAGNYFHLQDFIERTDITKEQLNMLISVGALRFTGKSKKKLLWEANFLQKKNKVHAGAGQPMFEEEPIHFALPELPDNRIDDLYDETELLDFPMCNPFEMVNDNGDAYTKAKDLGNNCGKVVTALSYFIDHKSVTTVKGERMAFCTFLDVNLDWIDTVHFPDSLRYYGIKGRGFYKITGKVVSDFGVFSIEVNKMEKVGYKERKYADL